MAIDITAAAEPPDDAEVSGVPVTESLRSTAPGTTVDEERCRRRQFKAKPGTSLAEENGAGLRVLVGLGAADKVKGDTLRRAGGAFIREASQCETAYFDLRGIESVLPAAQALQAFAEGVLLAEHRFERYKSETEPDRLERLTLVTGAEDAGNALERARAVAGAVNLARDLINTPAGNMTPTILAGIAHETAAAGGVRIEVFDEHRIADEGLGGLMGVARGSAEPPRLVKLVYEPDEAVARRDGSGRVPTVAIVGKGITFDSGGLSLKTGEGMMTMKTDMSGAAAVIATLGACRALGIGVRVLGFAPITENMPGGRATKPGDVLKARNGKTIEVLNTDAEGRLVLADGLSLAAEESPDAIVDLATLTGACVVALGREIAGLMGNDDRLIGLVEEAGGRAGERLWPLPVPEEYRSHIDSEIADMKNIGKGGQAGALVAALLLAEFVGDTPWAHLDIAGPARSEHERDYLHKGATGFGVRTMLELLSTFEAAS